MDNIQQIARAIKEKFNPKEILLFGSYAYGIPKSCSDIDILVIMDTDIPLREQAALIRKEIKSSIPVEVIVRTPQQIKERMSLGDFFIKKVMQKGIKL